MEVVAFGWISGVEVASDLFGFAPRRQVVAASPCRFALSGVVGLTVLYVAVSPVKVPLAARLGEGQADLGASVPPQRKPGLENGGDPC